MEKEKLVSSDRKKKLDYESDWCFWSTLKIFHPSAICEHINKLWRLMLDSCNYSYTASKYWYILNYGWVRCWSRILIYASFQLIQLAGTHKVFGTILLGSWEAANSIPYSRLMETHFKCALHRVFILHSHYFALEN